MLPSWIRSRNCRPRLVYFLAIEITRRRLASTISFLAWRASRSPFCTPCTILRNSPISSPVNAVSDWIGLREGQTQVQTSRQSLEQRQCNVQTTQGFLIDLTNHAGNICPANGGDI